MAEKSTEKNINNTTTSAGMTPALQCQYSTISPKEKAAPSKAGTPKRTAQERFAHLWTGAHGELTTAKHSLIENRNVYKNITLYATWEGTPTESESTTIPSRSESEIEGSLTIEEGTDGNYTLDIKKIEIPENLAGKNIKFMVDINLLNNNNESDIVEVNGKKMIIKIKLPETLKGYNHFEVAYIGINGEIKETLPATLKDGYITFETTHLSKYGIIATNKSSGGGSSNEEKTENKGETEGEGENKDEKENGENKNASENPITGDGIACAVALFAAASLGMAAMPILNKKK